MKTIPLLVASLLIAANWAVGEGELNLDDPKVLEKILGEALSVEDGERRGPKREALFHEKNSQSPYTGWVKSIHENGKVFRLEHYKNGKPDGRHIQWSPKGHKSEEVHFKDGEPVMVIQYYYPSGKKQKETNYKDGQRNGLSIYWHEDGQKEWEGYFKDGKRDGLWIGYESSRKNVEGHYKEDKKHGMWTFWDEDGKMIKQVRYKDGKMVKE